MLTISVKTFVPCYMKSHQRAHQFLRAWQLLDQSDENFANCLMTSQLANQLELEDQAERKTCINTTVQEHVMES